MENQYKQSKAPDLWNQYIGDYKQRTEKYINVIDEIFKKNNVKNVIDLATGTGIDSIALIEKGYNLVSIDSSDEMLAKANFVKEKRAKEHGFSNWHITKKNWVTLDSKEI